MPEVAFFGDMMWEYESGGSVCTDKIQEMYMRLDKQGRKSRTQFSHTDLYVFIQKLYFKKCALTFHNINKVTIS